MWILVRQEVHTLGIGTGTGIANHCDYLILMQYTNCGVIMLTPSCNKSCINLSLLHDLR